MLRFFQKNVNLFLMLVIVISVIAYAGSTVYYQDTFKDITSDSYNIKSEYETCKAELKQSNTELSRIENILNSTETDIERYDQLYETKATELTSTKSELKELELELAKYTALYTQEKKQAEDLAVEVTRLTALKNQLTKEANDLRNEVDIWQSRYNNCNEDLEECLG